MDLIRCGIMAIFGLNIFIHAKRLVRGNLDKNNQVVCSFKNSNKTMDCRKFTSCPGGYGLKRNCNSTVDTVCEKCPEEYFSSVGSNHCRKCRECPSNYHQIHPCTDRHNTRCKFCKNGRYFSKKQNRCLKCRRCPPGYFVKEECSSTTGTVCRPCPFGTFISRHSMETRCLPCRPCYYNEDIITPCTRKHDNICGDCRKGFFRLIATGECAKCSNCYRDFPGYTFEIDECSSQTNDNTTICMPVAYPPFTYSENITKFTKGPVQKTSAQSRKTDTLVYATGIIIALIVMLIMIIAISITTRFCCGHVDKTTKTCNLEKKEIIEQTLTAKWVNQLPTVSMRSNSVPFMFHANDLFTESRERSNTFTNDMPTKYLEQISTDNLNFGKVYKSFHSSEFGKEMGQYI